MYGEGWTGGESTLPESERGMKINAPRTPGIGMFSDDIRCGKGTCVLYG